MTVSALLDVDGTDGGFGGSHIYGVDDTIGSFSNFGTGVLPGNPVASSGYSIDVAAPGVDILSTYPGGNYAIMRPSREMLYVVLGQEQKYKAKNFIDTTVYRGGDAVSAWVYTGLRSLGLGLSGIAWIAVPLAALWALLAYRLGREQARLAETQQPGKQEGHESRRCELEIAFRHNQGTKADQTGQEPRAEHLYEGYRASLDPRGAQMCAQVARVDVAEFLLFTLKRVK